MFKLKSHGSEKKALLDSDFFVENQNISSTVFQGLGISKVGNLAQIHLSTNLTTTLNKGQEYVIGKIPVGFIPINYGRYVVERGRIEIVPVGEREIKFVPTEQILKDTHFFFDVVFPIEVGGGHKNPTLLFKKFSNCISKLTKEGRLALCL